MCWKIHQPRWWKQSVTICQVYEAYSNVFDQLKVVERVKSFGRELVNLEELVVIS